MRRRRLHLVDGRVRRSAWKYNAEGLDGRCHGARSEHRRARPRPWECRALDPIQLFNVNDPSAIRSDRFHHLFHIFRPRPRSARVGCATKAWKKGVNQPVLGRAHGLST